MVKGLELFRERFAPFADRYVLIGGTAATLAMEDADQTFRATKDLDIVLTLEVLDSAFASALWVFIEEGRYKNRQRSTGKRLFYRFYGPIEERYPEMLEFFSRVPDAFNLRPASNLTPIPIGDETASLSAILLESDYYSFIHARKRMIHGLPALGADGLIPLKAKAWLDLDDRKAAGEPIDEQDVKKHRNDILRLSRVIEPTERVNLPESIRDDLCKALVKLESVQGNPQLSLGIRTISLAELVDSLRRIYGIL